MKGEQAAYNKVPKDHIIEYLLSVNKTQQTFVYGAKFNGLNNLRSSKNGQVYYGK